MAIMDKLLTFDGSVSAAGAYSGQAITTTATSANIIDLGVARDMGVNDDETIEILVQVMTTFTAAGAATLTVAIQGAPDNGSGLPGTFTDMAVSPTIGKADLTAGVEVFRIKMPIVQSGKTIPRFLQLNYTVATGPMTAGAVWAGLILDRQANVAYPANYSTSYI